MLAQSEVFEREECYKNFISEHWNELPKEDRKKAFEELEKYMADKQDRKPREIIDKKLPQNIYGRFSRENPNNLYVDLDQLENESSYISMYVIVHEGRHAYQYDVINGEVQDISLSEEERQSLGKNFICYSENGADYYFQPLENDAFGYADRILFSEFKAHFEKLDSEEYKAFLNKHREMLSERESQALFDYGTENLERIQQDALDNLNNKYEQLKNKISNIQRLETLRDKCVDNEKREGLELDVQIEREHFDYPYEPEEMLRQIETFEHGGGVALKERDEETPQKDAPINIKIDNISTEQQLEALQQEYAPKQREIQSLNHCADNMEKYIKNINKTEARIAELKENRKKIPNADSRIKKLENSREKAHEFFMNEYFKNEHNVQPEKVNETITQLREQAEVAEKALKPTEEKMQSLQDRLKEQEIERSGLDGPTKDGKSK